MLMVLTGRTPGQGWSRRQQLAFLTLAEAAAERGMACVVVAPVTSQDMKYPMTGYTPRKNGRSQSVTWREVRIPDGEWQQTVVYDAMYQADIRRFRTEYKALLRELNALATPVFNPELPSRGTLMRMLQEDSSTRSLAPKTVWADSAQAVLETLEQFPRVWLKPGRGGAGRNLLYLERTSAQRVRAEAVCLAGQRIDTELESEQLHALFDASIARRNYLVQEHIPLSESVHGGLSDVRVTMARGTGGRWGVVAVTGRVSQPGERWTTYETGARVTSLTENTSRRKRWLWETGLAEHELKQGVQAARLAARVLAKKNPRIGILGLDVGLAEDGQWFVYDFHARPSRDMLTDREVRKLMGRVADFGWWLSNTTSVQSDTGNSGK